MNNLKFYRIIEEKEQVKYLSVMQGCIIFAYNEFTICYEKNILIFTTMCRRTDYGRFVQ